MIRADARLRVVMVNYNGGALLERAVSSVAQSQWPGEIDVIVVDNASTDGSANRVESLDGVHVIWQETNDGFGSNNLGFADLVGDELEVDVPPADVVALLNPDAFVHRDTFCHLAAALDADAKIGAASPLIIFDRPFVELEVTGDDVAIDSVMADGIELGAQCHGVGGAERLPGRSGPLWLCPDGSILRVPVEGLGRVVVGVSTGAGAIAGHRVDGEAEISMPIASFKTVQVVQNAGVRIGPRGSGLSCGTGTLLDEPRGPRGDLWCGAAVMFHPDYLTSIGGFDPEYFLYYEDVDLGLRGAAAGWRTMHVPEAIVEHRHSDRTVQGTELVEVLHHRNRLLTLVRHGSPREVASGFALAALTPVSIAVSAARNPSQRDERLRLAKWRAVALKDALKGIGHAAEVRKEVKNLGEKQ